jgi:hypothetical protein
MYFIAISDVPQIVDKALYKERLKVYEGGANNSGSDSIMFANLDEDHVSGANLRLCVINVFSGNKCK